jgi:hypothetical protein
MNPADWIQIARAFLQQLQNHEHLPPHACLPAFALGLALGWALATVVAWFFWRRKRAT